MPGSRNNNRVRFGKGFSIDELKEVGLNKDYARTIGISVDDRRENKSEEGKALNVRRLVEYKRRLTVCPAKRKENKEKRAEWFKKVEDWEQNIIRGVIPIDWEGKIVGKPETVAAIPRRKITEEEKQQNVIEVLAWAKTDAKLFSKREIA